MIGIGEMGIEIVAWGSGVGGMVTIATYHRTYSEL
jgi:hypothetical protein